MTISSHELSFTGGVRAVDLSDSDLEHQGRQAHGTRTWVVLHGTAEQYRRHTERMLELEQEYLRRHHARTWQGTVSAATQALPPEEREQALLRRYAQSPGGRLHKLEAHQAAREIGLTAPEVAVLFKAALLAVDGQYRQITQAGRTHLS